MPLLTTTRMTGLAATALLVACPMLAAPLVADAGAQAVSAGAKASTYEAVRGIGPAKRVAKGLLRVRLDGGATVLTHGLDREPAASESTVDFGGPERPPACAEDYYQHVLYGYPADASSRLPAVKGALQAEIRRMDALLNEASLASGPTSADYKVACDAQGEIRVDSFRSGQADAQTTFAGVLKSARQAGFDAPNADYTIFFDSSAPPACGTGTFSPDQRLTADNDNNAGGDYAVVYSNCWSDRTAMHENGHNQGAVQYDAPHSTGNGAHCNDGYDIMCYSDGGDLDVGMSVFCPDKMRFDCRNDTYFDSAPEPGEYLDSNWNLGSPLNRFIAFGPAAPGPVPTPTPAPAPAPVPVPVPAPTLVPPVAGPVAPAGTPPAATRRLPRLALSAARRYVRKRIRRSRARATRIRARCARRTRTRAICRARWKVGPRTHYRRRIAVRYRLRAGRVALAASAGVRSRR